MFMRLAPLLTRSLSASVSSDGPVCIIETNNHLLCSIAVERFVAK